MFNFATGQHNVAKVTKSAFDACNGGSAVFTLTSGPATVTLNETGEQYYICSVGSHCSAGQKLAINVNRASSTGPSPAPQPRGSGSPPRASPVPTQAPQASSPTPPPRSAPAPAFGPSSEPATFIVGETAGWIVPGNASFYTAWASGKNFRVGDVLGKSHIVQNKLLELFKSLGSIGLNHWCVLQCSTTHQIHTT